MTVVESLARRIPLRMCKQSSCFYAFKVIVLGFFAICITTNVSVLLFFFTLIVYATGRLYHEA